MRPGIKHLIIALTDGKESNHGEFFARVDGTFPPSLNASALALKSRGKKKVSFLVILLKLQMREITTKTQSSEESVFCKKI